MPFSRCSCYVEKDICIGREGLALVRVNALSSMAIAESVKQSINSKLRA